MRTLNINIEKNGRMIPVGVIEGNSGADRFFFEGLLPEGFTRRSVASFDKYIDISIL